MYLIGRLSGRRRWSTDHRAALLFQAYFFRVVSIFVCVVAGHGSETVPYAKGAIPYKNPGPCQGRHFWGWVEAGGAWRGVAWFLQPWNILPGIPWNPCRKRHKDHGQFKGKSPILTLVFSWDSQVCRVSVKVGSVLSKIRVRLAISRWTDAVHIYDACDANSGHIDYVEIETAVHVCEVSDILTFTFSDWLRTPQNASIFCG